MEGIITFLTIVSAVMWLVWIVFLVLDKNSVKINKKPIQNPFLRAILGFFVIPVVGVIMFVLGFVGWFILLPLLYFIL